MMNARGQTIIVLHELFDAQHMRFIPIAELLSHAYLFVERQYFLGAIRPQMEQGAHLEQELSCFE